MQPHAEKFWLNDCCGKKCNPRRNRHREHRCDQEFQGRASTRISEEMSFIDDQCANTRNPSTMLGLAHYGIEALGCRDDNLPFAWWYVARALALQPVVT